MRDEFEMKSNCNNVILVDTVRLKNDVRVSSVLVVYPRFSDFRTKYGQPQKLCFFDRFMLLSPHYSLPFSEQPTRLN